MNPEIKARWLEALRSGNYVQGKYRLTRIDANSRMAAHCCLGVLCELAVADNVVTKETGPFGDRENITTYFNMSSKDFDPDGYDTDSDTMLPGDVVRWAGLDKDNPEVLGVQLSDYNDGINQGARRHTFTEIANLIEEHL